MALSFDINANARQAQSQVKDLGEALEGVADSLDDVARDGARAGDKLEDSFRDMARAASRAGDDVGDDLKRGFKRAEEGAEEFKDEANSTAREAAASFDGSAESIADAFQEIAANAFAGFGPAGAVAGLAAAAGIGLAMAGFESVNEAQERAKELASEWAQTYTEEGSKVLSASTIVAKGLEVLNNRYDEVTTNAKLWGVAEETAVAAMAGSPAAIAEVTAAVEAQEKAQNNAAEAAANATDVRNQGLTALTQEAVQANKGREALDLLTGVMAKGATQADTYSYFLRDLADSTEGATRTVDEFGDTVVTLPDGKQIYIDAETGQATDNLDAIEAKAYSLPQNATIRVGADTSAANRALDDLQRRANKGIDVIVRPGQVIWN